MRLMKASRWNHTLRSTVNGSAAIRGRYWQIKSIAHGYGLNRIKARLRETSESWIAGIILVLNLVKLAGAAAPCLIMKALLHFSATMQGLGEDIFSSPYRESKIQYKPLPVDTTQYFRVISF